MIVHVTTQGARIVLEGRHLLVKKEGDTYHTLFPHRLEQLVLYGNVSLTPQAFSTLMREGVDTVFLRRDGRYRGRLENLAPKNVALRKRQFYLTDDAVFRLRVAGGIVQGKLLNMATLLMRIRRARKVQEAGEAAYSIRKQADAIPKVESLESLRGIEGAATRRYFSVLGAGFTSDFGFRKRVRRPPTDPVNSVLSLLYTFCINRMYAAIRQAGLDPAPGVLHDLEYGRNALPLDLVEEFRPIVADALTLSLFNLGVLEQGDFLELRPQQEDSTTRDRVDAASVDPLHGMDVPEDKDAFDMLEQPMPQTAASSDGKHPLRLRSDALKRVITAYEKKMDTEFHHVLAGERLTYAQAMVFQARLYRRVVEGEAIEYHPLLLR